MLDAETVIRSEHARDDKRTSVTIKEHGLELLLFFDDLSGEGPLRELRLLPAEEQLEPKVLRRFAPQSPLYLQYARAAIQVKREDMRSALLGLRAVGATRRGLGADFFKIIATNYEALIAEGEPHPVTALAAMHSVTISSASRWIKEAKQRGLIKKGRAK